jgi:hypothetical protein
VDDLPWFHLGAKSHYSGSYQCQYLGEGVLIGVFPTGTQYANARNVFGQQDPFQSERTKSRHMLRKLKLEKIGATLETT